MMARQDIHAAPSPNLVDCQVEWAEPVALAGVRPPWHNRLFLFYMYGAHPRGATNPRDRAVSYGGDLSVAVQ